MNSEELKPSEQNLSEPKSAELKPCPFCGGRAEVEREGTSKQSCVVVCEDCGCRLESNEIGHGERWNRRADPAPVDPFEGAPEWARWYAVDMDGAAYWFEFKPKAYAIGEWRDQDEDGRVRRKQDANWRNSLVERKP